MNLQYKLQEAHRVINILSKSRDVLNQTLSSMRKKTDKIVERYKIQLELLNSNLQEKDKELRLHQLKLRQAFNTEDAGAYESEPPMKASRSQRHSPVPYVTASRIKKGKPSRIEIKRKLGTEESLPSSFRLGTATSSV